MVIVDTVLELVRDGVGMFSDGLKHKREMKKAAAQNRQRLLLDSQSHNNAWEMASLEDKDKWLRRISFAIFVWPMTPISVWKPEWLVAYYDSLSNIPEWNVQLIFIMVGGVWGVAELKNSLPGLVGGLVAAVKGEKRSE